MAANGKTNGKTNGKRNGKRNGRTNGGAATKKENHSALNGRYVYAYQLDPPQPEPRFKKIQALVRQAQSAAKRTGRMWTGRIVVETLITHLLIVTDQPDHAPAVNRAIEAELKHLDMGFALNGPARLPWSRATRATSVSSKSNYDHARPIEKSSAH